MKQLTIFQTDPITGLHNNCVSFPNTKTDLTNRSLSVRTKQELEPPPNESKMV